MPDKTRISDWKPGPAAPLSRCHMTTIVRPAFGHLPCGFQKQLLSSLLAIPHSSKTAFRLHRTDQCHVTHLTLVDKPILAQVLQELLLHRWQTISWVVLRTSKTCTHTHTYTYARAHTHAHRHVTEHIREGCLAVRTNVKGYPTYHTHIISITREQCNATYPTAFHNKTTTTTSNLTTSYYWYAFSIPVFKTVRQQSALEQKCTFPSVEKLILNSSVSTSTTSPPWLYTQKYISTHRWGVLNNMQTTIQKGQRAGRESQL